MQVEGTMTVLGNVLLCDGPSPELGEAASLYAPVIGSWDVEVIDYERDGTRRTTPGEWHFSWALEGRALQDVFIVPKRGARAAAAAGAKGNRYGTTVRVYDRTSGTWHITWFNPVNGSINTLAAHRDGNTIVQVGTDADGTVRRWNFVDITGDSFRWTGEESGDGGRTWFMSAEFFARRKRG